MNPAFAVLILAAAALPARAASASPASSQPMESAEGDARSESPEYSKWFKAYNDQLTKNFSGIGAKSEVGQGRSLDPEVLQEQLNECGIAIDKAIDALANKEAVSKPKVQAAIKYLRLYPYSMAGWSRIDIILSELFKAMLIQSVADKKSEAPLAGVKTALDRAKQVNAQLAALVDLENAELMAAQKGVDLRAEMRKAQQAGGQ